MKVKNTVLSSLVLSFFLASPSFAQSNISYLQEEFGVGFLATVVYSLFGLLMIFLVYKVVDMMVPGHLHKQIDEDKNVALAIIVGLAMVAVAIIVAASMQ